MSALRIVKDGAPVLKKTAAPVKTITKRVKRLLDDMAETMYSAEGVGLAAPQVNESLQIVVLDDGNGLIELINPEILDVQEATSRSQFIRARNALQKSVQSLIRHENAGR